MARSAIPDPLRRRHLVEQVQPEAALAVAEAYLAEGREVEAVAFLQRAKAEERLRALRERAVQEGDVFLLREVSVALGEEPGAEAWAATARAAEAQGKLRYAAEARRQSERRGR
jgi:hypothetical protein